jgi:SP family general alpha glucoside:H+ symporter-like MFS transporter
MEKPMASHGSNADTGAEVVKSDEAVLSKMAQNLENFGGITQDAIQATEFERNMSMRQALRMYPKAITFSFILSLSLIMEGYDTSLLGSFFGYPEFQKTFGEPVGDGTYQLTASWQSGLQAGVQVGEILGLWAAGIIADRWGYKKTSEQVLELPGDLSGLSRDCIAY